MLEPTQGNHDGVQPSEEADGLDVKECLHPARLQTLLLLIRDDHPFSHFESIGTVSNWSTKGKWNEQNKEVLAEISIVVLFQQHSGYNNEK